VKLTTDRAVVAWPRSGLFLGSALSIAASACGGRSTAASDCPPGYVCIPECPPGAPCPSSPDGGASYSSSGGSDAGSPGSDAATPGSDSSGSPELPDGSYPEGSVPPMSSSASVLDYDVVDAKFSAALSSVVIVSDTPSNTLHIYDVATAVDRAVPLPTVPVAVAVDVTGTMAAVAYDAHVSWIDLQAGVVKTTCDVTADLYDVALSSTGMAYLAPALDEDDSLHVVTFSSCSESVPSTSFSSGSHIALHPSEKALFAANFDTPSSITRCEVTSSPIVCDDAEGSDDLTYKGNDLWISQDGTRIYTAAGPALAVPDNVTTDPCAYDGALEGLYAVQQLSDAPQAERVVLIPGTVNDTQPNADSVVRIYETQYLDFVAQYELPPFPLAGTATAVAHGRFVFTTPTMDALYVVVQADSASAAPNDFAIETVVP
jgi:hypothetical protein